MRVGVIAMPLPGPLPTSSPSTMATVTTRTTLRDAALISSAAPAGRVRAKRASSSASRRVMGAQIIGARFERKHRDARHYDAWQTGPVRRKDDPMTYAITGLDPQPFAPLFAMTDADLAARGARRVTANADRGFPCRISLEDARAGEELILLHHVSHDVATPYRSAYAIYVRQGEIGREHV